MGGECGGGVSTRESMKEEHTVTHHTHFQGRKGEESTGETQNRDCEQGEPLGVGPEG